MKSLIRSWQWWIIGSAVGILGLLLIRSAWEQHPSTAAEQDSSNHASLDKQRLSVVQRAKEAKEFLFPLGVVQEYEFEETAMVSVTTASQPITELKLRGQLQLTGLNVSADQTIRVRGEFSGDFTVTNSDAPADGSLPALARRPFYLDFNPDGSFRRGYGDQSIPRHVGRVWTALGEYLQLTRSSANDGEWEKNEKDAAGNYVASYEQTGSSEIAKHKLRYLPSSTLSYDVPTSSAVFSLDPQEQLVSFTLDEVVRAAPSGTTPLPGFAAATKVSLRRTSVSTRDLTAWLEESQEASAFDDLLAAENAFEHDRARIGNFNIASIFDQLGAFGSADKDARDRAGRAFVALTALLRRNPSALQTVRAHISKNGPLTVELLGALRDASTPETQKYLAELCSADSHLDADLRLEATRDLSRVPTPTADTLHALQSLRDDPDVGTQATYGMGSVLYRTNRNDPELAQEARGLLATHLDEASSPDKQASVLVAIGNSGDSALLDKVRPLTTSDSEQVRGATAQAVRRMSDSESDQILARACSDPSSDVRFNAIDAIKRERQPSPILAQAVRALAVQEPVFEIRARAVNVLVGWLSAIPSIRGTLTIIAQNDENADLRKVAANALEQQAAA